MSLIDLFQPHPIPTGRSRAVTPTAQADVNAMRERRQAASARMKALHADPEFKARLSKAASARMKQQRANPEFNRRRLLGLRRTFARRAKT